MNFISERNHIISQTTSSQPTVWSLLQTREDRTYWSWFATMGINKNHLPFHYENTKYSSKVIYSLTFQKEDKTYSTKTRCKWTPAYRETKTTRLWWNPSWKWLWSSTWAPRHSQCWWCECVWRKHIMCWCHQYR